MRLPVDRLAVLTLTCFLAACGGGAESRPVAAIAPAPSGPAADYPMVLGAPFAVDGVTYTPSDTLNYDRVGYAAVAPEGGTAVSIAHRTLPLPSYVEVTSLKTGKTILARVERRGPMSGNEFIALSPGAAAQLGAEGSHTPVRVRRVNPPEPERALLRTGQHAPERMDTPMPLVNVLMRKLEPQAAMPAPVPMPAAMPAPVPTPAPKLAATPLKAAPAAKPAPVAKMPKPAPTPKAERNPKGNLLVQVGAFASEANARKAAASVGGTVSPSGKLFRVRVTGLASNSEASAALAKVKAAGYSDARIQRAD